MFWLILERHSTSLFIAGLREYFAQTDERTATPRIPVIVNMKSASLSSKKSQKLQESSIFPSSSDQLSGSNRNGVTLDDESEEDEDFQIAETEEEVCRYFCFITSFFFTSFFC